MSDYIQGSWIMQDVVLYNEEIEKYRYPLNRLFFGSSHIKLGCNQGFGSFSVLRVWWIVKGCCVVECWCSRTRGGQYRVLVVK